MQYLIIRNARLATSDAEDHEPQTILIADGRIVGIGNDLQNPLSHADVYDAQGCYVIPTLISLSNPRPPKIDGESLKMMNFVNLTSGVATIITVSPDIDDNIKDLVTADVPTLNYSAHIPLRQVTMNDSRNVRRAMILYGAATSIVRFGDEKRVDIDSITPNITAAKMLGLRVLYDFRASVDPQEREVHLRDLCNLLKKDPSNRAFIVGIENEEELAMVKEIKGSCELFAHLCYDPFGQNASHLTKLSSQTIVDTLREENWCSLGLAYSVSKVLKEGWPDMTPEIIGRNLLPIINSIPADRGLSVDELQEYVITRPSKAVGVYPMLGNVAEGASASLIIWDPKHYEQARVDTPRGNYQNVELKGRIEAVVLNGKVVVGEKFHHSAVCGQHIYSRIL